MSVSQEALQGLAEMLAALGDEQLPHVDIAPLRDRARQILKGGDVNGHEAPPTPTFHRSRGSFPACGCMDIETDSGPIHVHDAGGLLVIDINRPDRRQSSCGIVLYDRGEGGKPGFGFVNQMGADAARNVAASLLRRASELDGGRLN